MSDDDWVKTAMTDDAMVADVLFSFKRTGSPPPQTTATAPLDWSVRQRRSRHPARHHGAEVKKTTKGKPTRASPTTPLTWSGGGATSVSGGSEESTKPPKPTAGSRSKVSVRSEATTSNFKRPRKKKTLAELKEDEALLLKEWKKLRNEIATMRLKVEKQRVTNENLKRLKSDLESRQKMETITASALSDEVITACPKQVDSVCDPHSASHRLKEVEAKETAISLPDLNLPAERDFGSEALCAMS